MIRIDWNDSIVVQGNGNRIRKMMQDAYGGKRLNIGFIGSAVTVGEGTSNREKGYAHLVFDWWKQTFPRAEFMYLNAGVDRTTPQFDVARVQDDLLCYEPDFILVEFPVNESETDLHMEAFEGLVRKLLRQKRKPAILILNSAFGDNWKIADEQYRIKERDSDGQPYCKEQQHNTRLQYYEICRYYSITCIDIRKSLNSSLSVEGINAMESSSAPRLLNDDSHGLLAEAVTFYLRKENTAMLAASRKNPAKHSDGKVFSLESGYKIPLTANGYESAVRYRNDSECFRLNGFRVDTAVQSNFRDLFKKGFYADRPGASITFYVYGSEIAIQYRKSMAAASKAVAIIDGKEEHCFSLDAHLEQGTDELFLETVLRHGICKNHTVEIRITESGSLPFYLVSVIAACNPSGELLFLQPKYKQRLWGGSRLKTEFNFPIPGADTGECWLVSAHDNGDCLVTDGFFRGKTLSELWQKEPELFDCPECDRFPLLIKILDAKEDLSVQVHPDNSYAEMNEGGSLGKTECWYVLDCVENAELIIGNKAGSVEEMNEMIDNGKWEIFLNKLSIQKGDMVQILPGTIHAIGAGTMVLEVQQSSDITYRLYDYDRMENGKKRELHLERAKNVITVPQPNPEQLRVRKKCLPNEWTLMMECEFYRIWKMDVSGRMDLTRQKDFLIISVINGNGMVAGHVVKKGSAFIVPASFGECRLEGNMELIVATV